MPNIFKAFLFRDAKGESEPETKVEAYHFPDASELVDESPPEEESAGPEAVLFPEFDDPDAEDGEPVGDEVPTPVEGGFDVTIDEQLEDNEPEPEPEKSGGAKGILAVLLLLILAGGGGAYAYLKFVKDKKTAKPSADLDDYDLEDEDEETIREYGELVPMFRLMRELSHILRQRRKKRGSIDFDFPESKILLDERGVPVAIKPYERNTATRIIEDFMLLANETVAQHFYWLDLPFVYRTHESPDPEKILKLGTFINNFGYHIKRKTGDSEIHPKEIQKLLGRIEGTDEEALIARLTLRSMKQAKYTVNCTGHFGLACDYYCHFTSPIRRYPDLQIHRIIKDQLRGRMSEEKAARYREILPEVAKHSSEMERRADEAERETEKQKKVQYMEERIGNIYEGVISGITAWGIYVELPNTVEGMIHVSKLEGDYFYYREETYEMTGRDTGRTFKLGEKVRIAVNGVDRMSKTIDFVLAD